MAYFCQAVEEKRARYEDELGRVNDMLTESENRRQLMLKETDALNKEVRSRQLAVVSLRVIGGEFKYASVNVLVGGRMCSQMRLRVGDIYYCLGTNFAVVDLRYIYFNVKFVV